MAQGETNLTLTPLSRSLCWSVGPCHLLNHPSGGQGHTAAAAFHHPPATKTCCWPVRAGGIHRVKTRLKQPSPQLVRRTENAGLLFKARMNGEYANHRLPRSSGRGGPTAGRPTPLHPGLSHESVCIPAAASGTRPGWGCSHRTTKISFRPKQNEALAGPGRLLDVVHTDPLRAPIAWILTEPTTFPEGAGGRPLRPLRKESTASGQGGRDQEMGSAHSEALLFCPFQK